MKDIALITFYGGIYYALQAFFGVIAMMRGILREDD